MAQLFFTLFFIFMQMQQTSPTFMRICLYMSQAPHLFITVVVHRLLDAKFAQKHSFKMPFQALMT